jgi:hypothetical protein
MKKKTDMRPIIDVYSDAIRRLAKSQDFVPRGANAEVVATLMHVIDGAQRLDYVAAAAAERHSCGKVAWRGYRDEVRAVIAFAELAKLIDKDEARAAMDAATAAAQYIRAKVNAVSDADVKAHRAEASRNTAKALGL